MIDIDALVAKCHVEVEGLQGVVTIGAIRSALLECERLTREECAKVCDELAEDNRVSPTDSMWQWEECAAAIRGMK